MVSHQPHVVKVLILGDEYPIRASVNDEAYVRKVAAFVDTRMRSVKESMKGSSTTKVAILAALNIADELMSTREDKDLSERTYRDRLTALAGRIEKELRDPDDE